MKSTKYVIHTRPKRLYKTRVVGNGQTYNIRLGRVEARRDVEVKLGRKLRAGTVETDTRGLWKFKEPRAQ